jgi:hypothetical protein
VWAHSEAAAAAAGAEAERKRRRGMVTVVRGSRLITGSVFSSGGRTKLQPCRSLVPNPAGATALQLAAAANS